MRRDNVVKEKKAKEKVKISNKAKFIIIVAIIVIIVAIVLIVINLNKEEEEEASETSNSLTLFNTTLGDYVKETSSGTKINTSTSLNENKEFDGLSITNIQLTSSSGVTTLLADVTNNTSEATSLKNVNITLIDEEGNELVTVSGVIMALEVGATTKLNVAISANYVDAYNFTITNK